MHWGAAVDAGRGVERAGIARGGVGMFFAGNFRGPVRYWEGGAGVERRMPWGCRCPRLRCTKTPQHPRRRRPVRQRPHRRRVQRHWYVHRRSSAMIDAAWQLRGTALAPLAQRPHQASRCVAPGTVVRERAF